MNITTTFESGNVPQLNRNFAFLRLKTEPNTKTGGYHSILLVDCSVSMTSSLPDVREDLEEFVNTMNESETVSIIIFSGHNDARRIATAVKCDKKGKATVASAIRKNINPIGVTVFSEPLEMALETVRGKFGDILYSVVLFTDGEAVPSRWTRSTEEGKSIRIAGELKGFKSVLSVIGYGAYYNHNFLAKLVAANGDIGIFRHVSDIDDLSAAVNDIREVTMNVTPQTLNIRLTASRGKIIQTLRSTPNLTVVPGSIIDVSGFYNNEVVLFLETSEVAPEITIEMIGDLPGVTSLTAKATQLSSESKIEAIRLFAAATAFTGDFSSAARIFAMAGDDALAEKFEGSYTENERREAKDMARNFARLRPFIGSGLKPAGSNFNVLNILRLLLEREGNVAYIPQRLYKRSGEFTFDPRIIEVPENRILEVIGIQSHDERFNFSLKTLKTVHLRPVDADGNITNGKPEIRRIYRNYNVILDGELHLNELHASLTEETFLELQQCGLFPSEDAWEPQKIYVINLRGVKLVSPAWVRPGKEILDLLKEKERLLALQTALNARIKALKTSVTVTTSSDPKDLYFPKSEKDPNRVVEYYEAKCAEIRLMRKPKFDFTADCAKLNLAEATAQVKHVRQELIKIRFRIRAITFAIHVTDSKKLGWTLYKEETHHKQAEWHASVGGEGLKFVRYAQEIARS